MSQNIFVLGVGNVLMGDDGFGPAVIRHFEAAYELPTEVRAFDAGTPGLDLTFLLQGADAVIAVDAVNAPGRPGDLRLYSKDDLLRAPAPVTLNSHEPSLREAFMRLEFTGGGPSRVRVVGVIPERVETGNALSPAMRAAIAPAVEAVAAELEAMGASIQKRPSPLPLVLWWEADSAEPAPTEPPRRSTRQEASRPAPTHVERAI